jgi:putative endonuclease
MHAGPESRSRIGICRAISRNQRAIKSLGTDIFPTLSTGAGFPDTVIHSPEMALPPQWRGKRSSSREVMAMDVIGEGKAHRSVRSTRAKDVLGRDGEQVAVEYLEKQGFRILDRNWRCAEGELDIVAVDRRVFVAVEVKTRSSTRFGTPLEAVGRAKQLRLRRLAVTWLNAHGVHFEQVRVDVVGLMYEGTGGYTIRHVRGVA